MGSRITSLVELRPRHVSMLVRLIPGTRADFVQILRAALGVVHELRELPEVRREFEKQLERERRRGGPARGES